MNPEHTEEQKKLLKETLLHVPTESELQEESYRWVNTGIYVLAALLNSVPVHTFTPINLEVQELYEVSPFLVTLNTLVFPVGHPLFAFLCNWILDNKGIRVGCILGSVLVILGMVLRALISQSFALVLVGSLLCSFGNIFILNSPSKLAGNWWNTSHLTAVNSICTLANIISNTIGAILPSFFVRPDSGKEDVQALLKFEAYLVGGALVLLIILIRDKPEHPPSLSAAADKKEPYVQTLKRLLGNANYLFLLLSISLGYGFLIAFFATIQFYIDPFNFANNAQTVSLLLASATLFGLIGSTFVSVAIKRSLRFKEIMATCYFCAAVEIVITYLAINTKSGALIGLAGALTGFFVLPVVPVSLQLGCEIAFPTKEATVAGLLLAGAQVLGFAIGLPLIQLFDRVGNAPLWATLIYVIMLVMAGLAVLMMKVDLKRTAFDLKLV